MCCCCIHDGFEFIVQCGKQKSLQQRLAWNHFKLVEQIEDTNHRQLGWLIEFLETFWNHVEQIIDFQVHTQTIDGINFGKHLIGIK